MIPVPFPCGQVFDVLRSCYSAQWRLTEDGELVTVDWSFADKNAPLIGVPSIYCSSRFDLGEDFRFDSHLGEQAGAQPWRNGSKNAGLTGRKLCFPLSTFETGSVPGDASPRAVDEGGLPLCCAPVEQGQGGALVGGRGDCTPGCDCAAVLTPMDPDESQWAGQCAFLGATMDLDKDGPCSWAGTWHTWSGSFTQRMTNDGATWRWEIDTSPTTVFEAPGDSCLPITVDYFVPDLPSQLFSLGIPCSGDVTLRFTNAGV